MGRGMGLIRIAEHVSEKVLPTVLRPEAEMAT